MTCFTCRAQYIAGPGSHRTRCPRCRRSERLQTEARRAAARMLLVLIRDGQGYSDDRYRLNHVNPDSRAEWETQQTRLDTALAKLKVLNPDPCSLEGRFRRTIEMLWQEIAARRSASRDDA